MGEPNSSKVLLSARKQTQGIETSKYLQEKKSKEIPEVAASELGRAQTCYTGVIGIPMELENS